jgi:exosortase K
MTTPARPEPFDSPLILSLSKDAQRARGSTSSPRAVLKVAVAAVAGVVIWRLKRYYSDAAVDDLRWILDPTARLVSLTTGARFDWDAGQGYLSRERLFLIAKVCAGINFMIAAFGMTIWMLSRRAVSVMSATVVLAVSALIAYATTIVVNAGRIAWAMWMPMSPSMHRLEGIVFYFGGLLVLYEFLRPRQRRSWVTPLCFYYAVTLAIPLANGAAASRRFGMHALIVLVAPPVFIAVVALCMLSIRAWARGFSFWVSPPSLPRRAGPLTWGRHSRVHLLLRARRRRSFSLARPVNPAA